MHSSAKLKLPPRYELLFCSCDKVYHRQEVRFLLHLLPPLNITLIHLIIIDHVLLKMSMIDSFGTVHFMFFDTYNLLH